jgi:predicted membrane channel-forming protein YqfA (hemolysin III family)
MLYTSVLVVHSVLRWLVLLAGVGAAGLGVVGAIRGDETGRPHRLANLAFLIVTDLQLLLGLALYAGLSPITWAAFQDFGAAMKNPISRYWAVEHLTGMILAIVVIHVAYAFAKRAKSARNRHIWAGAGFGVGLLLVIASIPWPFMAAGRAVFPGLG